MPKIAIAIHGGAGDDSAYIRGHLDEYEASLKAALHKGYQVLLNGGSAVDAVEAAVKWMEDDPLFNSGHGAALNEYGTAEMEAGIMDGKGLSCGAAAGLKTVRNPIALARVVMQHKDYVFVCGEEAMQLAEKQGLTLEKPGYFVTPYQQEEWISAKKDSKRHGHDTTGAVALDAEGNVAAATSTGGVVNHVAGRVGDSCMPGVGCYADNETCAVSVTGDAEWIIPRVIGHRVSAVIEYTGCTPQEACDKVLEKYKDVDADIGMICVDPSGRIGIAFNSERMHRAWMSDEEEMNVRIYRE